jgi:hypothetical protein
MLRADASRLLVGLGSPPSTSRPRGPAAHRRVEAIRRQLAPIPNPAALLASFQREAAVGAGHPSAMPLTPLRIAYAIRWIELMTGLRLPDWRAWPGA